MNLEDKYAIKNSIFMMGGDCCKNIKSVTVSVGHNEGTNDHLFCGSYTGVRGQTNGGQVGAVTCPSLLVGTHVTFDLDVSTADKPAALIQVAIFGFKLPF